MSIVLFGGTGFIGKALTNYFLKKGYTVIIICRTKPTSTSQFLTYYTWDEINKQPSLLNRKEIWINLSGESLNRGRWTKKKKDSIINSRRNTTKQIVHLLSLQTDKPTLFLNASAIGFYGTSLDATYTEETTTPGKDFLAQTVLQWEKEAAQSIHLGVRTCFLRFGIVLSKQEGALPKMVLPYNYFIGGKIGLGTQWVSWIHIEDVCRLVNFIIETPTLSGPINAVSPLPVTMDTFGKTIGKVINRPHWLPVPSFALKLLLGEMSTLILEGQRVFPKKVVNEGFTFKYTSLTDALQSILK